MPNIIIDWDGPYAPEDFLRNRALKTRYDHPGVYLRFEVLPDGEARIAYVGRATGQPTLWQRQVQHYANAVGGLYTIPREYRTSGTEWVPDAARDEVTTCLLDASQFKSLVEEAYRYLQSWRVFLWATPPDLDPRVVERNLLFDLKPVRTTWGTKSLPAERLTLLHRAPHWLSVTLHQHLPDIRTVE